MKGDRLIKRITYIKKTIKIIMYFVNKCEWFEIDVFKDKNKLKGEEKNKWRGRRWIKRIFDGFKTRVLHGCILTN